MKIRNQLPDHTSKTHKEDSARTVRALGLYVRCVWCISQNTNTTVVCAEKTSPFEEEVQRCSSALTPTGLAARFDDAAWRGGRPPLPSPLNIYKRSPSKFIALVTHSADLTSLCRLVKSPVFPMSLGAIFF